MNKLDSSYHTKIKLITIPFLRGSSERITQLNMKKRTIFALLLVLPLLVSCKNKMEEMHKETEKVAIELDGASATSERTDIIPGILYAKVTEEAKDYFKVGNNRSISTQEMPSGLRSAFSTLNTVKIEKLFRTDPRYAKRHEEAGLDRWIVIHFEDVNTLEGKELLSHLEEISLVEEVFKTSVPESKVIALPTRSSTPESILTDLPFNDPMLSYQWDFQNRGNEKGYVAGADINLFPAWEKETGKPSVIVAVIDGGIDYTHEDLKDNMWINEAELNGTEGIDDDGNGYTDDVYGYSFVYYKNKPLKKGEIEPDDMGHGTHVAGTIAARNNNGLGVSGIAGGDGTHNSGVRLMSCAIFREDKETGNNEAAMVYAADNGAVISQNSWTYDYPGPAMIPASMKEAIDYFIKYAGCDKDGNQRPDSPMKGGVVIFAAGNQNKEFNAWPGAYKEVISVSSMAADFTKAYYSNSGAWVSVMAPGGDYKKHTIYGTILSTVPPSVAQGNKYGYMQGTSMACPHVSGIAALIASKYGGPGFTQEELKQRLTSSFLSINIDAMNVGYEGKLGKGYVDADAALSTNQNKPPHTPEMLTTETGLEHISLTWKVPIDDDDKIPQKYLIYVSEEELTLENYTKGKPVRSNNRGYINGIGYKVGDEMSFDVTGLKQDTSYHLALVAVDKWGLHSIPALINLRTGTNYPPQAEGIPKEKIWVNNTLKEVLTFTVKDPEGHQWKHFIEGDTVGVSVVRKGDNLVLTIEHILKIGIYRLTLKLEDELGSKALHPITFEIFQYNPPLYTGELTDQIVGLNGKGQTISLEELFTIHPKYTLNVRAEYDSKEFVTANIGARNLLELTPHKAGTTTIRLIPNDGILDGEEVTFIVWTVDNSSDAIHLIYPIPVVNNLNILVNSSLKRFTAAITNTNGEEVFRQEVKPNKNHVGRLNLRELAGGRYTLHITSYKGNYKKSFIKQ